MNRLRAITTPFLALTLIALPLALAGCGSSNDASKAKSKPKPKPKSTSTSTSTASGGGSDTSSTTSAAGNASAPHGWLASCGTHGDGSDKQYAAPPKQEIDASKTYTAKLVTSDGTLTVELLPKVAPTTVNNFVFLACQGFYTNIKVHRIIKGFMMQTGDPMGDGTGGPGYAIDDEPVKQPYTRGILAMANAGANTGGSQFFIMLANYDLPPNYTIFGKVTGDESALTKIESTPVTDNGQGEQSKPTKDVTLKSVTITHT